MVAEGFSLRIGLQCNTDPETQPEGCGYQEITAPKGPLFRAKSQKRRRFLHIKSENFFYPCQDESGKNFPSPAYPALGRARGRQTGSSSPIQTGGD